MSAKYVYLFSEGNGKMRELLGGKGANLAEMTNLGMPVPQGFTVTTEACTRYYEDGKTIAPEIEAEIFTYLKTLEEMTGKTFGSKETPLMVSVRSGARASMPGMMDTILNLGLNDEVVEGLSALTQNERFAYDSYRRFIQMYSDVVCELPKSHFERIIDEMKEKRGVQHDTELTAADMKELVSLFKAAYKEMMKEDFPSDPREQLMGAIKAVFRSWDNPRAIYYRRMNDIPSSWEMCIRDRRGGALQNHCKMESEKSVWEEHEMENNLKERWEQIKELLLELPEEARYSLWWVLTHPDEVREMCEMEEMSEEEMKMFEEEAIAKRDYTMLALLSAAKYFQKKKEEEKK